MKNKLLWRILLLAGLLPFIIPVAGGIYYAIAGYGGYVWPYTSGFDAFYTVVMSWTYFAWPFYIIGALLTAYSAHRLHHRK